MNAVVNMLPTIAPKSDQLNADDLIGRTMTILVTKVSLCGEPDQPIAVHFEGDNGKPYKPGKSMRRVMVHVWGSDGTKFVGQRMTLYRDDKVQFGGEAVGGIRISHMTGIDRDVVLALTATRAKRKPFIVKPLRDDQISGAANGQAETVSVKRLTLDGRVAAAEGSSALATWWGGLSKPEKSAMKALLDDELKATASKADLNAIGNDEAVHDELTGEVIEPEADAFPGDKEPTAEAPETTVSGAGAGKSLADRVADFKTRCEGATGTTKLMSFWNASTALRSDLERQDPDEGAALEVWWNELYDRTEATEKGGQ